MLNDKKLMFPTNVIFNFINVPSYLMFEAEQQAKEKINAKELF